MIDHNQAHSIYAAINDDAALGQEQLVGFLSTQPVFQNKDYPFALTPLCISKSCLPGLRDNAEAYTKLLEKIVSLYRQDPAVRAFYGLGAAAERLIESEPQPARSVSICRLDGYVTQAGENWRILENNADAPAGTFFTPRLNQILRELLAKHVGICDPVLPMDTGQPFLKALLDAYRQAGGKKEKPFIAILQPRGQGNRESDELARAMNASGQTAAVVDPRELVLDGEGLLFGNTRIDLIWNKINTGLWNTLTAESPKIIDTLCDMFSRPAAPVHINSFGARYVAEAKTSLAFVHDPRFSHYFSQEEQALIQRLVPWTVKLERDAVVKFQGNESALADLLQAKQPELVVKQQYDIRGDGVTVGRSTPADVWWQTITRLWDTGAVVQQYVPPSRYPVILAKAQRTAVPMNVSLDSFVFNGRLAGLGAKASTHDKVNVFQGGSKLAVLLTNSQ